MAFERLKLTLTKEAIDFSQQWKDTGFANPATLKVTNVKYDAVSSKELELGFHFRYTKKTPIKNHK